MPCMLKLSVKDIVDKDEKAVALVIHATPFSSAFNSKCIFMFKKITSRFMNLLSYHNIVIDYLDLTADANE